jgi:hypothetical protein
VIRKYTREPTEEPSKVEEEAKVGTPIPRSKKLEPRGRDEGRVGGTQGGGGRGRVATAIAWVVF